MERPPITCAKTNIHKPLPCGRGELARFLGLSADDLVWVNGDSQWRHGAVKDGPRRRKANVRKSSLAQRTSLYWRNPFVVTSYVTERFLQFFGGGTENTASSFTLCHELTSPLPHQPALVFAAATGETPLWVDLLLPLLEIVPAVSASRFRSPP
jgi:hypothetical protein